jgi:biopolymer transport protein ExbD
MAASDGEEDDDIGGINVTPLVDVSLVLVLIFMVAVPMSVIHGINVQKKILGKYGLTTAQENIFLHLTAAGVEVKDHRGTEKAVAFDDVPAVVAGMMDLSSKKGVYLKVDPEVVHGRTVWLMDLSKGAGAADIAIVEGN